MTEAEVGITSLLEGSTSQGRQLPLEARNGREQIPPLSVGGAWPSHPLDFNPIGPISSLLTSRSRRD